MRRSAQTFPTHVTRDTLISLIEISIQYNKRGTGKRGTSSRNETKTRNDETKTRNESRLLNLDKYHKIIFFKLVSKIFLKIIRSPSHHLITLFYNYFLMSDTTLNINNNSS